MGIVSWWKKLWAHSSFAGEKPASLDEKPAEYIGEEAVEALAREPQMTAREMAAARSSSSQWADGYMTGVNGDGPLISPHFTLREVACRDRMRTNPTGEELSNAIKAAEMMEAIRSHLGDKAITVNSWYRTPAYNRQIGGAKNSMHMKGMAVDFTVAGLTPGQVQRRLIVAREKGLLKIGGIGSYKTFTHCDIGPKRTWQG